jgi:probable HAF family extracellular repeat protein
VIRRCLLALLATQLKGEAMKSRRLSAAWIATTLFVLPLWAQESQDGQQIRYKIINLGTLGGSFSAGNGLNQLGWVTGESTTPGDHTFEATLWAYGLKVPLGTLGGPNSGVLFNSRSNNGEIAGVSETATLQPNAEEWSCSFFFGGSDGHTCVGFIWRFGFMSPLPTLGGDNGFAAGINDAGQVVGWAENSVHDPSCHGRNQVLQFEAVLWGPDGGLQQQLPPYGSDPDGAAVAINDKGEVVGISGICDQAVGRFSAAHAVLWRQGTATDLGNLGGVAWNTPLEINSFGDIVGFSDLPGDSDGNPNFHAIFWPRNGGPDCGGRCLDLGVLPPDPATSGVDSLSEATGINNRGQIVGISIGAGSPLGSRAFLWQNGKITDLNKLVVPGTSLQLVSVGDINDRGEITGTGIDPSSTGECSLNAGGCAFLAVPVRAGDER